MKLHVIIATAALLSASAMQAQDGKLNTNDKPLPTIVSKEVRMERSKQDAKFAKEQRKLEKKQDKLAKQQRKFEKEQDKLLKAERNLGKERKRRNTYQQKLEKDTQKYSKRFSKGGMTPDQIAKWEAQKRKYERSIEKSTKDMEDANRKVQSLRKKKKTLLFLIRFFCESIEASLLVFLLYHCNYVFNRFDYN